MLTRRLLVACCIVLVAGVLHTAANEAVIDVDIVVSPHVLALESFGTWVSIHTDIPYARVNRPSCAVEIGDASVPVAWTKADSLGYLVVKLRQSDVKDVVSPGTVTVLLTGLTNDDVPFAGTDTIRVKP